MQKNGFLAYLTAFLLGGILALLGVFVFELNNIERRQIDHSNQVRALGENTDRLRGEIQRLQNVVNARPAAPAGATAAGGTTPVAGSGPAQVAQVASTQSARKYLHPEVENLLKPHDFEMTVTEADMNGTMIRPYGVGQIKGFNVLTENAADLAELWEGYCGESFARRMVWTNPDDWYGLLAERVEITDNNQEFTIYLKQGVLWHEPGGVDLGNPRYAWLRKEHYVTSKDVLFTFDMLMNPQVQNGFIKSYFEDLESWKAVDDHTVVLRWKKPYYNALDSTLSLPIIPEFLYAYDEEGEKYPEETVGINFNSHWYNSKGLVGTGPYRMVSYNPGGELRLERFEDYHGVRPAIKTVVWLLYDDPNLTLLKLKAHEVRVGGLRPSQYHEEIKKYEDDPQMRRPANSPFWNGNIKHQRIPRMAFSYIGWNADKPLFADKRVRLAMTCAFNREAILQKVYHGLGKVVSGDNFILSPYYDQSIKPIEYDLDRTSQLLKESGWEDSDGDGLLDKDLSPEDASPRRVPFVFTLLIGSGSPESESMAHIFQDDLLKIGVKMNIEAAEWSLMQQKMDEKDFDAFTGGWGLTWDVDPWQLWHSSEADKPKSSNRVGFRNAEADQIIETLRGTFDRDERIRLLHRFHAILHEEQPYTFFYAPESVVCWWDEVKRLVFAKVRPETLSLPWYVQTR